MNGQRRPRRFNPYQRGRGWRGNHQRQYNKGYVNAPTGPRPNQQQTPNHQQATCSQNRRVPQRRHNCPFEKWYTYFPAKAYNPGDELAIEVKEFKKYFEKRLDTFNMDEVEKNNSVFIDYGELTNDEDLKMQLPSIAQMLEDNPEEHLKAMSVAFHQALLDDQNGDEPQSIQILYDMPYINTRILNYEPLIALKNLKANFYGKLVSVRGTVVRVGNVKPLATHMTFICTSCQAQQVIELIDGKYSTPTRCVSPECRARTFIPDRNSSYTKTIDSQVIKLQEIMLDEHRETGRIPRTIECELFADLVDACVPGDVAVVTGIVKLLSHEDQASRKSKEKCMFLLYIQAVSVTNCKESKSTQRQSDEQKSDFTLKELYGIREIHSEKNVFKLIVGSLCPTIYGHELVKAGLVLGLFGGTPNHSDDRSHIAIRSDPHILIVGDPGLGKSQMLQAVSNAAPRGVYVCGNNTTTSGLTVTLARESGTGEYALEAGALVLADQGCCCIDEFDKMKSQHQALLEAMEQQSISIAKAGILCSLPARTSIIAAANPVGGHYNKANTVSENLKMNGALLSRFDLVFILLDNPDEELDCILSEHVMAIHCGSVGQSSSETREVQEPQEASVLDEARSQWEADKPLSQRLKISRNERLDYIPIQLLRKYIAYARKYVHPKLSPEAATILQDFYLMLRRQYRGPDSTPVTTRQLESLIRLSQARAKLELREEATVKDAEDVIEIVKFCLVDIFMDDIGTLNLERSFQGSGMSNRKQVKKFVTELTKVAERNRNSLFNVDQMKQIAAVLKIQTGNFQDFIEGLNAQNYIIKKGPRLYQLQTSNF
ncbi:DNA helicase MCM8-like [Rhopilema esculentum]|uniref:DNA helicase MCM8-like n=1 Tax=Rhopilema esculentum TaxID=499914 RepID=UPI0031E1AEAC